VTNAAQLDELHPHDFVVTYAAQLDELHPHDFVVVTDTATLILPFFASVCQIIFEYARIPYHYHYRMSIRFL